MHRSTRPHRYGRFTLDWVYKSCFLVYHYSILYEEDGNDRAYNNFYTLPRRRVSNSAIHFAVGKYHRQERMGRGAYGRRRNLHFMEIDCDTSYHFWFYGDDRECRSAPQRSGDRNGIRKRTYTIRVIRILYYTHNT